MALKTEIENIPGDMTANEGFQAVEYRLRGPLY